MTRALLIIALLWLPPDPGTSGGGGTRPSRPVPRLAVVRKPGITSYEVIVEELRQRVGATVKVFSARTYGQTALLARLRAYRADVLVSVGQSAYDVVRRERRAGTIIHALAYHGLEPAHIVVQDPLPPPLMVLQSLHAAKPVIRRVALLHGPGRAGYLLRAHQAAARLGIRLQPMEAHTPAMAMSLLRGMNPRMDALWLLPDIRLLTPQVFQYALGLQFRRSMPLMAATRRHTREGALFALDYAPRALGRRAAAKATRVLSGGRLDRFPALAPRLSVNRATARRMGAWTGELRRRATEVITHE